MKFNLISLALVVLLTIFTFSCSTLLKENYSLYENNSRRISIQYPKNWEKRESDGFAFFMAISIPESPTDYFRENVNIVTEPAPGYNLDEYYQANLISMKTLLNDFKILAEGKKTINNNTAKWVIYNHRYNEILLKVKAYFFYESKNGIVFTATANPSSFKKYETVFDDIVSTLRFK